MSQNTVPGNDDGGYLVVFDSDRIKDYVFATGRLKEIRGASMLVADLTGENAIENLAEGGHVIYADGAAGMVQFHDPSDAHDFQRRLERDYRLGTVSGTLSTAFVEVREGEKFSNWMSRAMAALRRAKGDRRESRQLMDNPYMRFCESCREYPVEIQYDERDLCRSCATKRKTFDEAAGQQSRQRVKDDWLGSRIVDRMDDDAWNEATFPHDLSELGEVSRPENYLGFIYCDGNQMGAHLRQMPDKKAYAAFSKQVSLSTREAVISALCQHFPEPRRTRAGHMIAPFEILLIGGDDLILVTAADRALEVALTFCKEFQRETKLGGREVSMSGGVVLAHTAQPILSLELRSRELLRQAKDHVAEERRSISTGEELSELGAIDFLIITTPTLNPLAKIRHQQYWEPDERVWRTQRPYTLDRLALMIDHIRAFKAGGETGAFPRNKLNSIYQALFKSKNQAAFEASVIVLRLSQDQRKKLFQFADDFGFREQLPWGYDSAKDSYSTALADLIELYDFVPSARAQGGENGTD